MRRIFAALLAALLLAAPALGQTSSGPAVLDVNGKRGHAVIGAADVGAAPCPGSCALLPAFFAALKSLVPTSSQIDVLTAIGDAPGGPITLAYQTGHISSGDPLAVFVQARYALATQQMAAVFTQAGAGVATPALATFPPLSAYLDSLTPTVGTPGVLPPGQTTPFTPYAFQQPDTGALLTNVPAKLAAQSINVVPDFCAVADGTTDNTSCIQTAVNVLCARSIGGGQIVFPTGIFSISASVGINIPCGGIDLRGSGRGDLAASSKGTLINVIGSGAATIFNFAGPIDPGDSYVAGGKVENLTLHFANTNAAVTQTGTGIYFAHNRAGLVRDVRIWAPFNGVWSFSGIDNGLDHVDINQVVAGGMGIFASGSDASAGSRQDIFSISHVVVDASVQAGYASGVCAQISDFVQTVRINYLTCNQVGIGLNINCPTSSVLGDCPAFFNIFDFEAEPNAILNEGAGIAAFDFTQFYCAFCQIYGGSSSVTDTVSNGRIVSGVKMGNSRFGGTGDIQFVGGFVSDVNQSCVVFNGGNFSWSGGRFKNCNRSGGTGSSLGYAFDLRGATIGGSAMSGSIQISNNWLGYFNGTGTNAMGSVLLSAGQDYDIITGNILRGSAAVVDNSGGTHNVISGNAGP